MNEFTPQSYFTQKRNNITPEIIPNEAGLALILHYLKVKYDCNIHRPINPLNPECTQIQDFPGLLYPLIFNALFFKIRNENHDVRHAFILDTSGHAVFLAYIREANEECFLYASTRGAIKEQAIILANRNQIKIFLTEEARQANGTSTCLLDAVVFARDITRKNQDGSYYIPNIITLFKQREQKITENVSSVLLPNQLLKTTHRSNFFDNHLDKKTSEQLIHKNETIHSFRARYSQKSNNKTQSFSTYLYEKSMKYQSIMEIQFYLNKVEEKLKHQLSTKDRLQFIKEEKERIARGEPFSYEKWISNEQSNDVQVSLETQNCCIIS